MTAQEWDRLKRFFNHAIDLDPAGRAAFLTRLEQDDPSAASELKALLAEVRSSGPDCDTLGSASIRELISSLGASGLERVEGYRIVGELGRGSSSIVFRACCETGGKPAAVALKIFRFHHWDEIRKRQFATERLILSQLNHPNIAKMFAWGATPAGFPYLVMELVEGQTLDAFCRDHALSLTERLSLFAQVLDAVAFAHRNAVIHRDLKPANILVTADGRIKLLDFGISKLFESDPAATATLERRFTPAYASPEQIRSGPTGPASDIYSLGVILYELLCGQLPYRVRERNVEELSLAVVEQKAAPPGTVSPDLPRQLDQLVLRALEKSPANRYSSVEEFSDRLNQLSLAGHSREFQRYFPQRALAIGASLAALLLALAWLLHRAPPGHQFPGTPYPVTPAAEFAAYPSLSAATGQMAYASDRGGQGNLHIWLQNKIDSAPVSLTSGAANDTDPDFSADGQWVAFHSEREPKGIYLARSSGGPAQFLAPFGLSPRFSPAGHTLVYWTADPYTRFGSVWRINLDSSREPFRLARDFEDAHTPVWTPDGHSVLVCGTLHTNRGPAEGHDLWVVPADGSRPIKTGAFPLLARGRIDLHFMPLRSTSLRWIEDGILVGASQNGASGLWVIPISRRTWTVSGNPYLFSSQPDQWRVLHPAVSGSAAAFARVRESIQIWSLPIDAESAEVRGPLSPVTRSSTERLMPSASLDGRTVLFLGLFDGQILLDGQITISGLPLTGPPIRTNRFRLSGDGRFAFWQALEGRGKMRQAIDRINLLNGQRDRVCEDCGGPVSASFDGSLVLYENGSALTRIGVLRVASGGKRDLIYHPYHPVRSGRLSTDGRWVAFVVDHGHDGKQLFVSPFHDSGPAAVSEWIPLTSSDAIAEEPAWSPAGNWIYYFDRSDGFRCLWARRWNNRTGKPLGAPLAVHHFHIARLSPLTLVDRDPRYIGLSVARDRLFLTLSQFESQVWRADLHR